VDTVFLGAWLEKASVAAAAALPWAART